MKLFLPKNGYWRTEAIFYSQCLASAMTPRWFSLRILWALRCCENLWRL